MNATLQQSAFTPAAKRTALEAAVHLDPNGGSVHLRDGHYVKTRDALGWRVHALTGAVWITQDWDSRDIVLNAGESFVLDRNGAALLWPLGDTEICLAQDGIPCARQARPHDATPAEAVSAGRGIFV